MTMRRLGSILALATLFGLPAACGSSSDDGVDNSTSGDNGGDDDAGTNPSGSTDTDPPADTSDPTMGNFGFCPDDQPEAGAMCQVPFPAACTYGDGGCVCTDDAWECYSSADCPASAPDDGAACDLEGMACGYDGSLDCTCSAMDGWSCQTPCPQAQPDDGASCQRPTNASCGYVDGAVVQGGGFGMGGFGMADTTCACSDGGFVCFSEDDCPTDAPSSGDSCDLPTLTCNSTDSQCRCDPDGAWTCVTDCPEAFPDDGAACDRPEEQVCRYGDGALVQGFGMFGGGGASDALCTCSDMQFECLSQEDCPSTTPSSGDDCTDLVGLACDFDASSCNCDDTGTWGCQSQCPAALPESGDSCDRSANQPCRYTDDALVMGGGMMGGGFAAGLDADDTCSCIDQAFSCFSADDCPAATPDDGATCDVPGLLCAFDTDTCACSANSSTWACFMVMTPPDNGAGGQANAAGGQANAAGGQVNAAGTGGESSSANGGETASGGTATEAAGGAGGETASGGTATEAAAGSGGMAAAGAGGAGVAGAGGAGVAGAGGDAP